MTQLETLRVMTGVLLSQKPTVVENFKLAELSDSANSAATKDRRKKLD